MSCLKSKRKVIDSSSPHGVSSKQRRNEEEAIDSPIHNEPGEASPSNPNLGNKSAKGTSAPNHNQTDESLHVNQNLPSRLFPVSSLPHGKRLNIYSKPEYLGTIVELLKGSEAWTKLMDSQFSKLFELPVSRCSHSAKIIHGMFSRQLVTKKTHEIWFVYGGYPVRFSLLEFHRLTGLRCGPLPAQTISDDPQDPVTLSVCKRLFGSTQSITVSEVLDLLREDQHAIEENQFTTEKKLSLALLVLIDGVLATNNKDGRVTFRYVKMLDDLDSFLAYPWGRESYRVTMKRLCPFFTGRSPTHDEVKITLGHHTSACYGFPVAFQLHILETFPALSRKIKEGNDLSNFIKQPSASQSTNNLLRDSDIKEVESLPTLSVHYTVNPSEETNTSELAWSDEEDDPKVDLLISLINKQHVFKSTDWTASQSHTCHAIVPESDDDDVIDIIPVVKGPKKRVAVSRRPNTRSTNPKTPVRPSSKLPPRRKQPSQLRNKNIPQASSVDGTSASQFVTQSDLAIMKDWIKEQLLLKNKESGKGKSALRSKKSRQVAPSLANSRSPKRRRYNVESLSSGSSSAPSGLGAAGSKQSHLDGAEEMNQGFGDDRWLYCGPAHIIATEVNSQNPQAFNAPLPADPQEITLNHTTEGGVHHAEAAQLTHTHSDFEVIQQTDDPQPTQSINAEAVTSLIPVPSEADHMSKNSSTVEGKAPPEAAIVSNSHQSDNGHLACSSCCPKLSNKCPMCASPVGQNRCRTMESVLESVFVPCQNSKFGCTKKVSYGKESIHEKECTFSQCSCPALDCNYTGSYSDIYTHFVDKHCHESKSMSFVCGGLVDVQMNIATNKILVLWESEKRLLFALQCFNEPHGVYVTVRCIAPSAPELGKLAYCLYYSMDGRTLTYKSPEMKMVLKLSSNIPQDDFMFVPHSLLRGESLEMKISIGLKVRVGS